MGSREENETRKVASLKARESFLKEEEFKKNLVSYSEDNELLKALSSQGAWSKYERDGFLTMTLNTYKRVAKENLYEGFDGIDIKRDKAHSLLTDYRKKGDVQKRDVRADTKRGLEVKNENKDKQLSILREANLVLSKGIEVTIDTLETLAKDTKDADVIAIIKNELPKVRALLRREFNLKQEDSRLDNE
jgi:hypothetical protein